MKKGERKEKGTRLRPSRNVEGLELTAAERQQSIAALRDYLARTGMHNDDFARRIGYSGVTLRFYLRDMYHSVGKTDSNLRRAIAEYMAAHPIEPPQRITGELYDTANVRTIRETFQKLLPKPVAYMIYAPPGSQKSFVLEHEISRLNREELAKNGHGRRAYYVYARQGLRPRDLMKRVTAACGVPGGNEIDRMLANLRHDFQNRRTLLIIDEAQHLEIESFEVLRELLDQPPFFSLLFAGSHDLKQKFDRFSATLEQWNSRIIAKVKLPGLLPNEARGIIEREVGDLLRGSNAAKAEAVVAQLIKQSTTQDAFEKGRTYINVRTLTNALDQIKASVPQKEEEAVCA